MKLCPCGYGKECAMHCGDGHEHGDCPPRQNTGRIMDEFEHEYESQYRLPECNSPKDARRYPGLHQLHSACPVHSSYQRDTPLREWAKWRATYASLSSGDYDSYQKFLDAEKYALNKMLECVTPKNPPEKPVSAKPTDPGRVSVIYKWRPSDGQLVAASIVMIALVFCLLAMLI